MNLLNIFRHRQLLINASLPTYEQIAAEAELSGNPDSTYAWIDARNRLIAQVEASV